MDAVAQRQLRTLLEQYQDERASLGRMPISVDRLIEELEEPPSVYRIPDFTQDELQALRDTLEEISAGGHVVRPQLLASILEKLKPVTDAPR